MKKYLFALGLLLIPSFAFAEVPQGVMGFMDGKLYNTSTNALAYLCFMDGNCYDKEMKFAFAREAQVLGITIASPTPAPTPSATPTPVITPTPETGKLDCAYSGLNKNNFSFKCINTYSTKIKVKSFAYKLTADKGLSFIKLSINGNLPEESTLSVNKIATSTIETILPTTSEFSYKPVFQLDSSTSPTVPVLMELIINGVTMQMEFLYQNDSYYQGKLIK